MKRLAEANRLLVELYSKEKVTSIKSFPVMLEVQSGDRCNLRCVMCQQGYEDLKQKGNNNIEYSFLNEVGPFLKTVTLLSGEPFFFSEKIKSGNKIILDKFSECFPHTDVHITTNATLMNEETANFVLENIDLIRFSVDSLDPAVYKSIRKGGVLDKTLENIHRLSKMKKDKKLSLNDPPLLAVNTIIMRKTWEGLDSMLEFIHKIGGVRFNLLLLRNHIDDHYSKGLITEDIILSHKERIPEILAKIREIKKSADNLGIQVEDQVSKKLEYHHNKSFSSSNNIKIQKDKICPMPWYYALVMENGNVGFCCANQTVIGNVNNNIFKDIWHGNKAAEIREKFTSGEYIGCDPGGCPAQKYYLS